LDETEQDWATKRIEEFYIDFYLSHAQWQMIAERYPLNDLTVLSSEKLWALKASYWYLGRYEELSNIMNELLSREPEEPLLLNTQSALLYRLGKNEEAITILKKLVAEYSENTVYRGSLAANYEATGNYDKALSLRLENFELKPSDTEIIWNYGRILYLMGHSSEAKKLLLQLHVMVHETVNNDELLIAAWIYLAVENTPLVEKTLARYENNMDNQKYSVMDAQLAAELYALSNKKSAAIKHIENALSKGMSIKHFAQPQFNSLCQYKSFIDIINQQGVTFCTDSVHN
jgi:tetratricopeptide (TPR) repeat protein